MGQTWGTGTNGRHRQERLHRHRAPAFPALFASRGRSAISLTALTATLATGIGVAGAAASAATPGGHTGGGHTAAHATAALPIVPPLGDDAPGKAYPRLGTDDGGLGIAAGLGISQAAPVKRMDRPVPVVAPPAVHPATAPDGVGADWVNPNPAGQVTSCFGPRWGRLHAGVDIAAPDGSPIVAAGAGVVIRAGLAEGYGNAVLIDHGNGWLTHYGHLSRIAVTVGQVVQAGEQIGDEGSTGHSTGPHLHFEVHEGHYKNPVEPTAWMHQRGVDIPGCDTY
ncbi:M23 family metallopeptidase [Actinoplanes sp. HUAS TT8]|uniref:M23 family metallopeptidase n=1 Tax=Actinoplanes sp. HUAS TT8 TaxID=3447453 RepID=UPI003F51BB66